MGTTQDTTGLMMMAMLRPLLLMTLLACSISSPVEQDILGDMVDSLVVEGREMDVMDDESSDVGVDNVQMKAEEDEDDDEDEVDRMGEMQSINEEKKQKKLARKKPKKAKGKYGDKGKGVKNGGKKKKNKKGGKNKEKKKKKKKKKK